MIRRFFRTLAFVVSAGVVAALGQDTDSEVRAHFLAARQAQTSHNLDAAVKEYSTVIRLAPDLVEARVNLGLVYYQQTRYEESARAFEKVLTLQPGFRGANLFLGIDEMKLGQGQQAVPFLRRAVEQEPGNQEARSWLGRALWDAGQKTEAILELRDAARAFPSDPDILFLLGQAYRNAAEDEMGRVLAATGTPLYDQAVGDIYREAQAWEQAERHYQRALERDPHWVGAHLGLGEIYFQQGKWQAARTEFLAEGSSGTTAKAAQIALLAGQPGEALRLLAEAIQKEPDGAANGLGLPPLPFVDNAPTSEEAAERYRQAQSALEQAAPSASRSLGLAAVAQRLGLREELARAWRDYRAALPAAKAAGNDDKRALSEFERHDFESARLHLVTFLAAHGKDGQARYLLAKACHSLSLAVLAEMLATAPNSPRTHQLYALTLAEQEENEKALAEYRKVEAAAPGVSGLHFAVGELLWKMKRLDQALAEFEQELRLNPGDAETSAAAGTILVGEHHTERAIPYLQRALQLKPGLVLAHLELGKAYYQRREFAKAGPELEKARTADNDGSVHYFLGVVYRQSGREAQASAAFAESMRIKDERLGAMRAEKPREVEQ